MLTNIIKNIKEHITLKGRLSFVAKAQTSILSAAAILFGASGISAILGLVKGRLLTHYFGVSPELGIFYTADRIPFLLYSVLVTGALSTVFIPVFTNELENNKDEAYKLASSIINAGIGMFLLGAVIITIFADNILNFIAVGRLNPEELILGANIMRIMIFAQILLVISSFVSAILQAYKQFLAPALAIIVYNLGMILGIYFLQESMGIYAPAIGVIIGAVLHLLIQIPELLNKGFEYTFELNLNNKNFLKTLALIPPRITSVILHQTLATINNSLAILISTSSVVILKFASQLQFFPVSLFGASIAAASLPILSQHNKPEDSQKFFKIFITTFLQMMFLVLPISVILFVLRVPVVRLVFGVDNFPWEATVETAKTLGFFSISIFAQSGTYLLTRGFYALKNTITPLLVTVMAIFANVMTSLFFINSLKLGVWSLALAFSISSILEMFVLFYLLTDKLGKMDFKKIATPFLKIATATVLMAISIYAPMKILDQFVFDTSRTINLILLSGIVSGLGMITYLGFTTLLDVEEIELFYKIINRFKLKPDKKALPAALVSKNEDSQ